MVQIKQFHLQAEPALTEQEDEFKGVLESHLRFKQSAEVLKLLGGSVIFEVMDSIVSIVFNLPFKKIYNKGDSDP